MATNEARRLLESLSDELAGAVERAERSVVTVEARRRLPGSGVVWPGGLVVTADHVLERDEDVAVVLADGQRVAATLVGRDPGSDLAVLRLATGAPVAAELAPAGSVRVGHLALALGRPTAGPVMASFGIVSALGGTWRTARGGVLDSYVRADLAFYPGFSGGPLVDVQGRVLGIDSSHLARGQEIAVPTSVVDAIVQALVAQGRVRRAFLGVTSQPVRLPPALRQQLGLAQESGLLIVGVEPGSPAEQSGLMMGDLLVTLAGRPIAATDDLQAVLASATVGQPLGAVLVRGGQRKELSVTPGERA